MKTKLFAVILAGLLLLSATACTGDGGGDDTTKGGTPSVTTSSPIVINPTTDENGSIVTTTPETQPDTSETNPTFENFEGTVYVGIDTHIRTNTIVEKDSVHAVAKKGDTYTATGVSTNWYRITIDGDTYYISKRGAIDKAVIDTFEDTDDEVVVTAEVSLNLRALPSSASELMGSVKNGDKLERIAVGDGWSFVRYTKGETTIECYVSNKYIKSTSETATTEAATTEAANPVG